MTENAALSKLSTKEDVFAHDVFNIVALSIIAPLDLYYLWHTTSMSSYSTPIPCDAGTACDPKEMNYLAEKVIYFFVAYLVLDIAWILRVPSSVQSKPSLIIIHHIATLCLVAIPVLDDRWYWHGMIDLVSEVNTLFLTLKRIVPQDGLSFQLSNLLFYFTWGVSRVFLFPVLAVYFTYIYIDLTEKKLGGNYLNPYAVGPALQLLLAGFSAWWTYLLVVKKGQAPPIPPKENALKKGSASSKGDKLK